MITEPEPVYVSIVDFPRMKNKTSLPEVSSESLPQPGSKSGNAPLPLKSGGPVKPEAKKEINADMPARSRQRTVKKNNKKMDRLKPAQQRVPEIPLIEKEISTGSSIAAKTGTAEQEQDDKKVEKSDDMVSVGERRRRLQRYRSVKENNRVRMHADKRGVNDVNPLPYWSEKAREMVAKNFIAKQREKKVDSISINTRDLIFASYMMKLKNKISMTWRYPLVAQRMGWTGVVDAQFLLNDQGDLVDIELVHSSGYTVLDRAVVDALRAAAPFDRFPPSWKALTPVQPEELPKGVARLLLKRGIVYKKAGNELFFGPAENPVNSDAELRRRLRETAVFNGKQLNGGLLKQVLKERIIVRVDNQHYYFDSSINTVSILENRLESVKIDHGAGEVLELFRSTRFSSHVEDVVVKIWRARFDSMSIGGHFIYKNNFLYVQ